jgi:tetratricopeptide (TPR) repeat protein
MKKNSKLFFFLLSAVSLLLFNACSFSTDTGDSHMLKGSTAYRNENYSLAIEELNKAADMGVKRYKLEQVYTLLGNTYCNLKQYEKAIDSHKKSLEVNPEFCEAWVNMGVTYRQKGNYDKAEECYKKAMEINPKDPELWSNLGSLHMQKGENDKAITEFEKAIELNNNMAVTHGSYALALAIAGRYEDADKALDRARELNYKNADVIQEKINELKNKTDIKNSTPTAKPLSQSAAPTLNR